LDDFFNLTTVCLDNNFCLFYTTLWFSIRDRSIFGFYWYIGIGPNSQFYRPQ